MPRKTDPLEEDPADQDPDFSEDGWVGIEIPETGLPEIPQVEAPDKHLKELYDLLLDASFTQRPETDEQLWEYIRTHMGVRIPRTAVCVGHQAPFASVADLFFLRHPNENALLVGGRGTGKTLNFALLEVLLMIFYRDTIANVGAVEEQAKKCYSYIQRVNRSPRFAKLVRSSILSKTTYKNGAEIEILPGTMNRVNSPHPRIACISGDALILTDDGEKRMRELKAGDTVWGYIDGKLDLFPVAAAWSNGRKSVVSIAFDNGRTLKCTADHRILTSEGWATAGTLTVGTRIVSRTPSHNVRTREFAHVLSVKAAGKEDVFDATIEHAHNFIANSIVVHNCLDEIDLMSMSIIYEALSMPVRTNNRPPQTVYTSSLKKRYGPMIRLMEDSQARAIRTYTSCVFEVIKNCPPTRHQQGEGCLTCPLATECLDSSVRGDGTIEYQPGPGRASRADGFMDIDDVIKTFRSLDQDTWDSQWRCKKPSAKNLIYPQFDEALHVIDYEWNPNLPVHAGYDFGYTNPSVGIYLQVLPSDEIVVFAENFGALRTDDEFANSVKAEPWYRTTLARDGDPAAASARATFRAKGIDIVAAINTKDLAHDDSGISKIRWLLAPPGRPRPLLYFARGHVPNTIREIKGYHTAEQSPTADKNAPENAAKVDDHCMDALRYAIARLIKRKATRPD